MISKSQVVLYIYDELIDNKILKTSDIVYKYNVSPRTVRRYISEVNAYLYNNFKNLCVVYDHFNKWYCLKEINKI